MKLIIPTDLSEIKLYQYQKFIAIDEPQNEDVLKCFLDLDAETINQMKVSDVEDIAATILATFKKNDNKFTPTFKLNNDYFGFIPNLDEITYGENKDITTYLNDWKNMHRAMAVMYRPITHKRGTKYVIEDYKGTHVYSDIMKDTPLNVVFGSMVFFWNLTNELLKAIPNFLAKQTKKEQIAGRISVKNGEAIQKSLHLLKATLDDLMKFQHYPYTNA